MKSIQKTLITKTLIAIVNVAAFCSFSTQASANDNNGSANQITEFNTGLELTKCFVEGIKSQAQCGQLQVAEDRSKPISESNFGSFVKQGIAVP